MGEKPGDASSHSTTVEDFHVAPIVSRFEQGPSEHGSLLHVPMLGVLVALLSTMALNLAPIQISSTSY